MEHSAVIVHGAGIIEAALNKIEIVQHAVVKQQTFADDRAGVI